MPASTRNKNLDFLRGIAVLLVMAGHFFPGYIAKHVGWSGVDLFFVLSGFFISGILFREYSECGKINTKRFLLRRGLKIWPLFYSALLIQLIYFLVKGQPVPPKNILHEIFFIQNYLPGFMVVTWSLGIEEQFYLVLALGLTALFWFSGSVNAVFYYCVVIMVLCIFFRIFVYYIEPFYDPYKKFYPLHLRADSLCAGIILSYFYYFKNAELKSFVQKRRKELTFFCILLLSPLFYFGYDHSFTFTVGFTFTYLGYAVLVVLFLFPQGFINRKFNLTINSFRSVVAWIGFYSYAIYLFHFFIGFGVVSNFKKLTGISHYSMINFLVFLASNIIFGYLASKLIEQPILKWRDRVLPANSQRISI